MEAVEDGSEIGFKFDSKVNGIRCSEIGFGNGKRRCNKVEVHSKYRTGLLKCK